MRKLILLASLIIIVVPQSAYAITAEDQKALNYSTEFFGGTVSANFACSSGSDVLDGHRLPATKGGAGLEQHLSVAGPNGDGGDIQKHYELTNVPQSARNGFAFAGSGNGRGALPTNDPKEEQYYITMRWRYATWAWNGKTKSGPEDVAFYKKNPKVLVTNPRTNKSVVAAVIEAGPAPYAGSGRSSNNPPSYWQGYQDGTPSEYKGRVSGLSPEAFQYLGVDQRTGGTKGDDLLYSWANDQNATPGPTNTTASSGSSGSCTGGNAEFIKNPVFDGPVMDNVTAVVLHWTGGTYDNVDQFVSAIQGNSACPGGCSVQLFINKKGEIYQLTDPLNTQTAHAAGINSNAIGIEIEGVGEEDLLSNDKQFQGVVGAVNRLIRQYNIPKQASVENKEGVLGHFETDSASYGGGNGKTDPGREYLQKVKNAIN